MAEIQIELTFNRTDFEEIYFKDNQGSIFFSKSTKEHFLILLVFSASLLILLVYCISTNSSWIGFVLLLLICLVAAFSFFYKASSVVSWKKNVNAYLNNLSKYQHYKVVLTETAIAVIMDKVERIEKWTAIQEATITDEFVSLVSAHSYLFPKKSMTGNEYELLKAFVSQRVKNGPLQSAL